MKILNFFFNNLIIQYEFLTFHIYTWNKLTTIKFININISIHIIFIKQLKSISHKFSDIQITFIQQNTQHCNETNPNRTNSFRAKVSTIRKFAFCARSASSRRRPQMSPPALGALSRIQRKKIHIFVRYPRPSIIRGLPEWSGRVRADPAAPSSSSAAVPPVVLGSKVAEDDRRAEDAPQTPSQIIARSHKLSNSLYVYVFFHV